MPRTVRTLSPRNVTTLFVAATLVSVPIVVGACGDTSVSAPAERYEPKVAFSHVGGHWELRLRGFTFGPNGQFDEPCNLDLGSDSSAVTLGPDTLWWMPGTAMHLAECEQHYDAGRAVIKVTYNGETKIAGIVDAENSTGGDLVEIPNGATVTLWAQLKDEGSDCDPGEFLLWKLDGTEYTANPLVFSTPTSDHEQLAWFKCSGDGSGDDGGW